MWEVWEWDGNYIKGKLLKRYRSKDSATKWAAKNLEFTEMVQDPSDKDCFFLDDSENRPIGVITKKKS